MTRKEILRLERLTQNIYCIIKVRKIAKSEEDYGVLCCIKESLLNGSGIFRGRILNVSGNQTWIELEHTKMIVIIPTNFIEFIFPLYSYKDEYNKIVQEIIKEEQMNQEEAQ